MNSTAQDVPEGGGVGYRRSPQHWDTGRIIVFRVEDTLYSVSAAALTDCSEGFEAILNIPGVEGTEEHPIPMHGISKFEFDSFLSYIRHVDWKPLPLNEELLRCVLKVSMVWMCKSGSDYALHRLDTLYLSAPRRLQIAQEFGIRAWIRPAVEELMKIPVYKLSGQDEADIGGFALKEISKAHLRIGRERVIMAGMPPSLITGNVNCQYFGMKHSESKCQRAWDSSWWSVFGKEFLHPTEPLAFDKALDFLKSMEFVGVSSECKDDAIASILNSFGNEEIIINRLIETLEANLPMSLYNVQN